MAIGAASPHSPGTFRSYNAKVTGRGRRTLPMPASHQSSRQFLLLATAESASLSPSQAMWSLFASSRRLAGCSSGVAPSTAFSVMRRTHALLPQRMRCCHSGGFAVRFSFVYHQKLCSTCRHVAVNRPI